MILRRFLLLTAVCSLLAGVSACRPAAEAPAPPHLGFPLKPGPGMVWKVEGGKSPCFLAGSFHLLRAEDYPLPEPYETAWRESRHLVMEILPDEGNSPESSAELRGLMRLETGTLEDRLNPGTWQELAAWASQSSTPLATFRRLPPWLASLTVSVRSAEKLGFLPGQGIEKHFLSRPDGSEKTREGLETPLQQLQLLAALPADTQEAMLRQALEESRTLPGRVEALAEFWRSGDTEGLHARLTESFQHFPDLKKLLITDRNTAWLPRVEALLQSDRPSLILVGAAHLCGPGSVIALLESKGYRCIRLPVDSKTESSSP